MEVYPGGMCYHQGKILFGLVNAPADYGHVWSYNLKTGALLIENEISSGFAAGQSVASVASVSRDSYLLGWFDDDNNEGIDKIQNDERYTGYKAVIISAYYPLGSRTNPEPLSEIEIVLDQPLATGQGVRLSYRTDVSAAFTTIGTYDFATIGTVQNYIDTLGVTVESGIQFKAELTTASASSATPRLKEIRIR
jgi:hypothetical protein